MASSFQVHFSDHNSNANDGHENRGRQWHGAIYVLYLVGRLTRCHAKRGKSYPMPNYHRPLSFFQPERSEQPRCAREEPGASIREQCLQLVRKSLAGTTKVGPVHGTWIALDQRNPQVRLSLDSGHGSVS